jgi:hypothetical protein
MRSLEKSPGKARSPSDHGSFDGPSETAFSAQPEPPHLAGDFLFSGRPSRSVVWRAVVQKQQGLSGSSDQLRIQFRL